MSGQPDPQTIQALELIHNPRSSNEHRNEAYQFLENVKTQEQAPQNGYLLALNSGHPPVVRHFGLSLLEHAIKHQWGEYSPEQTAAVWHWVMNLAQNLRETDPPFIRNKVAQLWVEVAKRSSAQDLTAMDQTLIKIWKSGAAAEQMLVLEILETLSEDSIVRPDHVTVTRDNDLASACVDIFMPWDFPRKHTTKQNEPNIRHGDEGWLSRIIDFLMLCINQNVEDESVAVCALKAASTLRSVLGWVPFQAVESTQCVQKLCKALTASNVALQTTVIQGLIALYHRHKLHEDNLLNLAILVLSPYCVGILQKLYAWSTVDVNHIDEERYLLCKRLTEMILTVGQFIQDQPRTIMNQIDLNPFLDLTLQTVQDASLHVSIPMMHLWAQLINAPEVRTSTPVMNRIGQLLQICSERLIRYEEMPIDSEIPAITFLNEDIDTPPEKHAFLGNYARFCRDVIDGIVAQQPAEALDHILKQTDNLLSALFDDQSQFNKQKVSRVASVPSLRLDAQASVVEAAIVGYAKWRAIQRIKPGGDDHKGQQQAIDSNLERWTIKTMELSWEDPALQHRVVILIVSFASGPLRKIPSIINSVFEYILTTKTRKSREGSPPGAALYHLQVQELQKFCSYQLQRLAMRTSEYLVSNFTAIQNKVEDYCNTIDVDEDDRERCGAVLFIIVQRAPGLEDNERIQRLDVFIQEAMTRWQNPGLAESLTSLDKLLEMLGIAAWQGYFVSKLAETDPDWTTVKLDEQGRQMKARIEVAQETLPLRITKTFLSASVDRVDPGSPAYNAALSLWTKHIMTILPRLLSMIRLSHTFSEPSTWRTAPRSEQMIIRRIMKDRFWQVGISTGTRDEFYAKIDESKATLEGLGSAIRACMRNVRETSYRLLAMFATLGPAFYQFDELPQPLCEALFTYPASLSTHQMVALLETGKVLVENCPIERQDHFLTPFLSSLFSFLDAKTCKEWELIDERNRAAADDDDLTEEMKEESILRNLTFNAVLFVSKIFHPPKGQSSPGS